MESMAKVRTRTEKKIRTEMKMKIKIFLIQHSSFIFKFMVIAGLFLLLSMFVAKAVVSAIEFTPQTAEEIYSEYVKVERLYWLW